MGIEFEFADESLGQAMPTVVIFQKNVALRGKDSTIAWKVIRAAGDAPCAFTFQHQITAGAIDSSGEVLAPHRLDPGEGMSVTASPAGGLFAAPVPASTANEIQIRNGLFDRKIDAHLYRGRRLLARASGLGPSEVACFRFDSSIWIGVASVIEGQVMHAELLAGTETRFALHEIEHARIVLRGGEAEPYRFDLIRPGETPTHFG